MDRALFYGFALSVLLIVVVYFVGVSTDASALGSSFNSLLLTLTGRDSSGAFAQYPNSPATATKKK